MKILNNIKEEEMIVVFLQAELCSIRFKESVLRALAELGADEAVITNPDLNDEDQNEIRQKLLALHRGYGRNDLLFEGFPNDVEWMKIELTPDELLAVKYMNYSYWNELSNGTRDVEEAVENIRINKIPYGKSRDKYLEAAESLQNGQKFPEIIIVGEEPSGPFVVLEGHLRLTAYGMVPEKIQNPTIAILGISPDMNLWMS